ncbi:bifunctional DNA-formamidopyrimidine glycosylase/DNA-(apurinic or apyrimidinic site) lyase [Ktedonosporobacter rubrisoli]|uniref:Formamidopyrimidine-DNA glycosylase n=1 Tax=Ktedonosporobacter rubrisoli TaxID=2509675 RepID=A0A4P6JTI7_KTERU|nr:bifunctional DNA-formamidopyrimidine glycosylase/DNA-(apurinic or apyrimidinic site) lyase [Ktedonosporobacter rubrisoli]QBD78582.1 bifunctional DNA-formamidopyrimidine glycosylase/DNA-(apurinic or apyrimidinic site) lyase [Ktedonosporobacter rubrisoli]
MPELPEVEYTARQLRASIIGATIQEARVFWERTIGHPELPDFLANIAERRIEGVRRRGKYLLLDLSGQLVMTIHRRMTGNFLLLPPGWELDTSLRETDPAAWSTRGPTFSYPTLTDPSYSRLMRYCRMCFILADGRCLLYTDLRKFGRIELWPSEREQEALGGLGPEPLSEEFTSQRLKEILALRKSAIKPVLLDQTVVAGLGNIYADEALFYAGIHPLRPAESLTTNEIDKLWEGIVSVLTSGIERGGTSFSDYRDLWGEAGDNFNHVRVYQRDGKPCLRCGTPIERIVIAQRSTCFCPQCQPFIGAQKTQHR